MHKLAVKGEPCIQFETARNLNSSAYLAQYFDFHEQLANDWAEQLYALLCETWKQQTRPLLRIRKTCRRELRRILVAGARYVPNLDTLCIPFRSELIHCVA
jgi:hypothetical protein